MSKSDRFPPLHDHMPPEDAFPSVGLVFWLWSGFCIGIGIAVGAWLA